MKKCLKVIFCFCIILSVFTFAGCQQQNEKAEETSQTEYIVVTSEEKLNMEEIFSFVDTYQMAIADYAFSNGKTTTYTMGVTESGASICWSDGYDFVYTETTCQMNDIPPMSAKLNAKNRGELKSEEKITYQEFQEQYNK